MTSDIMAEFFMHGVVVGVLGTLPLVMAILVFKVIKIIK